MFSRLEFLTLMLVFMLRIKSPSLQIEISCVQGVYKSIII